MRGYLETAGELIDIESAPHWVSRLIIEAADGELHEAPRGRPASMAVRIEADDAAFETTGWEQVTRGAWRRRDEVVIRDACTAGFDLHVRGGTHAPVFTFRWRPPMQSHAAAWMLRSRFHLLARSVLLHYPALWLAGTHGRVPIHASAFLLGRTGTILSGAGGVGKSTLIAAVRSAGGLATGDNLCVSDGQMAWGLIEPLRLDHGDGRRMPHGRREVRMTRRVPAVMPDRLMVMRRGAALGVQPLLPAAAVRSLVAGTYIAGELRRYWAFAATLAAALESGPPHPHIEQVATRLAERLPAVEVTIPNTSSSELGRVFEPMEAIA